MSSRVKWSPILKNMGTRKTSLIFYHTIPLRSTSGESSTNVLKNWNITKPL